MAGQIRLDKFLADMSQGTRSQLKEAARKGRITVNGEVEKKSDRKIDPDLDEVMMDGRRIGFAAVEYYMLNKPQGVISATEDKKQTTVLDLIEEKQRKDLFPVGRLDIDTEGLLLITNDGDLAHQLLSPKKHVDKVYYARIQGKLPIDCCEQFRNGITISDGVRVQPADLVIRKEMEGEAEILLTIREGKFHQVKRMFEAVDCQVAYLKRLSMGPLTLDEALKPGEYRPLTPEEIKQLKERSYV